MRVLVTGATGFTGGYVLTKLLARGASVRCFVRGASDTTMLPRDRVETATGDLGDRASLVKALRNVDILVNVASIGFGHAPTIVQAAIDASVPRALFVSTTAIFTTLPAATKSVRLAAEATIRESGLAFTILRPTMIYGSSRDRNISRLIAYLRTWPVIPVVGSGDFLQQPVHVEDVAAAIADAIETPAAVGRSYNVAGAAPLTYNQVIDTICAILGRSVRKVHLPAPPIVRLLTLAQRCAMPLPVKPEQIRRLNEDKAFDYSDAAHDFNYHPRSFADGVRAQIEAQ